MMGDAASTIGNAMTGRKHDSSFYNNAQASAGQGVKDIQDRRKGSIENDKVKATQAGQDPDSDKSKGKRDLYKKLFPEIVKQMPSFDLLSSDDIEELKSPLELAQRAKDRMVQLQMMKEQKDLVRQEKELAKQDKVDRDIEERTTVYGLARTKDDAKKLKEAAEDKDILDRSLEELIDLRNQKGVEYLDKNAVQRGEQLSKKILLSYKNLAKLGVLSKSDEDIINAIVPEDPLGQDWTPFQDPILHRLTKFRGDIQADFNTRLQQRLVNPPKAKSNNSNQEKEESQKPGWAR
jgi:hypothetical protein